MMIHKNFIITKSLNFRMENLEEVVKRNGDNFGHIFADTFKMLAE